MNSQNGAKVDYQDFDERTVDFVKKLKRVFADINIRIAAVEAIKTMADDFERRYGQVALDRIDAGIAPVLAAATEALDQARNDLAAIDAAYRENGIERVDAIINPLVAAAQAALIAADQKVAELEAFLAAKQSVAEKGQANGYAGLDATGKVPGAQLPALTTTATVGAALAGASQEATPADGDRLAGIKAGGSTPFWITFGNLKARLKSYFDGLYPLASSLGNAATRNIGTGPNTVAAGDDERFGKVGLPIGALVDFPVNSIPEGFLVCDGSSFDAGVYPDLYDYLGSNVLPDYTDRVRRMTGPLAGAAGTTQEDEIKLHGHPFRIDGSTGQTSGASGGLMTRGGGANRDAYAGEPAATLGMQIGGFGGAETRVKAGIVVTCIRAYGSIINQGEADLVAIEQAQAYMLRFDAQTLSPALKDQVGENIGIIGLGQTWQDVTASRTAGTTYHNATGRPIFVSLRATASGAARQARVSEDGSNWVVVSAEGNNLVFFASFVVPADHYYGTSGAATIWQWAELS